MTRYFLDVEVDTSGRVRTGDVSLWLTSDFAITHFACGARKDIEKLGARFEAARVAIPTVADCCQNPEAVWGECSFDTFDEPEYCRRVRLLSESLARAEGRDPRPYSGEHICTRHGWMCVAPVGLVP